MPLEDHPFFFGGGGGKGKKPSAALFARLTRSKTYVFLTRFLELRLVNVVLQLLFVKQKTIFFFFFIYPQLAKFFCLLLLFRLAPVGTAQRLNMYVSYMYVHMYNNTYMI